MYRPLPQRIKTRVILLDVIQQVNLRHAIWMISLPHSRANPVSHTDLGDQYDTWKTHAVTSTVRNLIDSMVITTTNDGDMNDLLHNTATFTMRNVIDTTVNTMINHGVTDRLLHNTKTITVRNVFDNSPILPNVKDGGMNGHRHNTETISVRNVIDNIPPHTNLKDGRYGHNHHHPTNTTIQLDRNRINHIHIQKGGE